MREWISLAKGSPTPILAPLLKSAVLMPPSKTVRMLFMRESTDGLLTTGICSRTAEAENAKADLDFLRSLKK